MKTITVPKVPGSFPAGSGRTWFPRFRFSTVKGLGIGHFSWPVADGREP